MQGQLKNSEVFETIISHLENSANKHVVHNISKEDYLVDQENFYVRGADTLEGQGARVVITNGGAENKSVSKSEQLRELHQLKSDGVITQEEFEQAKRRILDKY